LLLEVLCRLFAARDILGFLLRFVTLCRDDFFGFVLLPVGFVFLLPRRGSIFGRRFFPNS
jgi:hypothetical protein